MSMAGERGCAARADPGMVGAASTLEEDEALPAVPSSSPRRSHSSKIACASALAKSRMDLQKPDAMPASGFATPTPPLRSQSRTNRRAFAKEVSSSRQRRGCNASISCPCQELQCARQPAGALTKRRSRHGPCNGTLPLHSNWFHASAIGCAQRILWHDPPNYSCGSDFAPCPAVSDHEQAGNAFVASFSLSFRPLARLGQRQVVAGSAPCFSLSFDRAASVALQECGPRPGPVSKPLGPSFCSPCVQFIMRDVLFLCRPRFALLLNCPAYQHPRRSISHAPWFYDVPFIHVSAFSHYSTTGL